MQWTLSYHDAKREGRMEGLSEGESIGLAKGELKAKIESAVIAVREFGISAEMVSEKYGVDLKELNEALERTDRTVSV